MDNIYRYKFGSLLSISEQLKVQSFSFYFVSAISVFMVVALKKGKSHLSQK
jgi:hypothetical protein